VKTGQELEDTCTLGKCKSVPTRTVTVLKPKPKTSFEVKPNHNQTAVFWWPYDGFSRISKTAQSDHKCPQTTA